MIELISMWRGLRQQLVEKVPTSFITKENDYKLNATWRWFSEREGGGRKRMVQTFQSCLHFFLSYWGCCYFGIFHFRWVDESERARAPKFNCWLKLTIGVEIAIQSTQRRHFWPIPHTHTQLDLNKKIFFSHSSFFFFETSSSKYLLPPFLFKIDDIRKCKCVWF